MNTVYFSMLFLCFAASIVASLNRNAPAQIRAFVILMLLSVVVEAGNEFHLFPAIHHSNHWTFNIETVFEFYFFSYFFYKIVKGRYSKRLIRAFVIFYPVILLASFATIQKFYAFHTYTYILGSFYLIILCLLFYRELYMADEFKKLSTLPEFWIVTGLLVFLGGELPYMILLNYLNIHYIKASVYFNQYIIGTLNIVMYIMFIIGLLCSRIQK